METNLIQTLLMWWATVPSDFKFLLLLPFAIGGTALLTDALRRGLAARGWRLRSPRRYSCTRDPSSMTQLLGSWK
jgi:hypothetical protein